MTPAADEWPDTPTPVVEPKAKRAVAKAKPATTAKPSTTKPRAPAKAKAAPPAAKTKSATAKPKTPRKKAADL